MIKMVKIRSVWSGVMGLHVELENGQEFVFRVNETETKEMIIERIKEMQNMEYQRWKAKEEKTIDPKLKHLKKLEGIEIE